MSQSSAVRAKIRRASYFVSLFVPLTLTCALGSCGGTASSTRDDEAREATAGTGGSSTAGSSGAGSGGQSATGSSSAGMAAAGTAGTGAMSAGGGGADGGGAAGEGSTAGAGGESNCVDVCSLHGPTCCIPSVACVAADARCVIDFYDTVVPIAYQYADLEQTVAALPQFISPSVSTADIEWVGVDAPATARIEMHLSAVASALYGTALEGAVMHPFRVSCDGQSLFVGQVYALEGAAALQTPVLHVSRDVDGMVILRLGAWQGAWASATTTMNLAARERIDRPELRATLCLAGALKEL